MVPRKITTKIALRSDGAELTIMGAGFEVDVRSRRWKKVELIDNDPDLRNPRLIQCDSVACIVVQVWHGIDRVLIPIDV